MSGFDFGLPLSWVAGAKNEVSILVEVVIFGEETRPPAHRALQNIALEWER
ncbi:hypothetical protein [Aliirhizobium smilacinae]|uniref:hypothetical protein n=1 Tax=Aliirhizobium smilacinae TaxID=1395944 RepID=UPI0015D59448|nr:hypothetical protein [Rhizobium smilacinae]